MYTCKSGLSPLWYSTLWHWQSAFCWKWIHVCWWQLSASYSVYSCSYQNGMIGSWKVLLLVFHLFVSWLFPANPNVYLWNCELFLMFWGLQWKTQSICKLGRHCNWADMVITRKLADLHMWTWISDWNVVWQAYSCEFSWCMSLKFGCSNGYLWIRCLKCCCIVPFFWNFVCSDVRDVDYILSPVPVLCQSCCVL